MRQINNILVTGGCGFIGTNFIRLVLSKEDFKGFIVNLDSLTYAGNLENLKDIDNDERYRFINSDISDINSLKKIISENHIDTVVHFAAESHVDRSILSPYDFITTNIIGTFNLLESCRQVWGENNDFLFHHISTDEVYGSLDKTGFFYENTPYAPRSPYSASKASSDHFVKSYYHTYGLNVTISNCSNNYGPYQFPEKLIPLFIMNILEEKPLPVYGDGQNIRDWLYVEDHCFAIWEIINKGTMGETYNIGGECELKNIDLVNILCEEMAKIKKKNKDYYKKLIKYVSDRPGHDRRYAINCDKIKKELNWATNVDLEPDWIKPYNGI